MKPLKGVVAAGHDETANAAIEILSAGGNAFDAAVAAMLSACVAEPVLASLGGGGFLTARPQGQPPVVYDFFPQTPIVKKTAQDLDFYPIEANFGTTSQTFHIGMGAIATPGFIRGLFSIYRHHCRLALHDLFEPAIRLAKEGVTINSFQHLIATIVAPILNTTHTLTSSNTPPFNQHSLLGVGERYQQTNLASFLDALEHEGERLFYEGEAGKMLIKDCHEKGGHLTHQDLTDYKVIKRQPLQSTYRNARLFTNPLPSLGGTLITFALGLMDAWADRPQKDNKALNLRHLARCMRITQLARGDHAASMASLLSSAVTDRYHKLMMQGGLATHGTTQLSIVDTLGNLVSITLSNGEGCGYTIPHTDIMMNNMLGEEDLNHNGFHHWPVNQRLASMMAPTLVMTHDGEVLVTGSGGSNRIRSAILQVILNYLDRDMSLHQAVSHPRVHYEGGLLSVEKGIERSLCEALRDEFPKQQWWHEKNLFFGGAHSVLLDRNGALSGVGDERRGGVSKSV
jgi:gamma-glutamyltranspeptidase/glutathione hydrolase